MKKCTLLGLAMIVGGCADAAQMPTPVFDGSCNEYERLGAQKYKLPHTVDLWVYQNTDRVWLCYSLPDNSSGMLDLIIDTPQLDKTYNLHVSAQLGEWIDGDDASQPKGPKSDIWWNQNGWYSNVARFHGMREANGERHANFVKSAAREMHLSKERFGRGEWKMVLKISGVRTIDEKFASIIYPKEEAGEGKYLTVNAD